MMTKTRETEGSGEIHLKDLVLGKKIGEGGQSQVFIVKNDAGEQMCLKSVHVNFLNGKQDLRSVKNELEALNTLDFPFLMRGIDYQKMNDSLHFMFEFIEGETLEEGLMTQDLLSVEQSRFYFSQIILIMQYLHQNGFIYRDFKPQNFII